jgi:hypothetical protein
MTPFDGVQFTYGHPVPTRDHATLLASYHLLLEAVGDTSQTQIAPAEGTLMFEDWELTRSAFIARMAGTLRHLGYLAPSYSRLDGFALARTLVDHVITFAWITGAPRERLPIFLRSSYQSQLWKDTRSRERGDEPLLTDELRERLETYTSEVTARMPKLHERAAAADDDWVERANTSLPEALRIVGLKRLYDDIYDHFAAFDHPTTLGLMTYVHEESAPLRVWVDGEPRRERDEDLRPYSVSTFAFAEALIVSNLATGRPRLQPLTQALEVIGAMHSLERQGRLDVTQDENGITIRDAQPPSP